jgi:hypothetical protein
MGGLGCAKMRWRGEPDRMDHLSNCKFRCNDPNARSFSINLRKTKMRNNRIGTRGFLNQYGAKTPNLESMLLARSRKIFLQQNLPNRKYSGSLIRARAHRSSRVLARRHDKVQSDQQKNLLNILNDSVISTRRVALVFMRKECSAYSCDRSVRYHRTTR